jgi:hypothetical protein
MLQTEAAVPSSATGQAEDPAWLSSSIVDAQFKRMDAERLLAEVALALLDDQASTVLIGEHAEASPNKQPHGDEQAEPGSFGEHVFLLSCDLFETGTASEIAES